MASGDIVVEQNISARGIVTYSTEIVHHQLGKHRRIKDQDYSNVIMRAEFQLKQWAEQWAKKQAREKAARERAAAQQAKETAQRQAAKQSDAARDRLDSLENTLHHTLSHDDAVNWNDLKDRTPFPEPKPVLKRSRKPVLKKLPFEPDRHADQYRPRMSFLDGLISKRRMAREQEAKDRYSADHIAWEEECAKIERSNASRERNHAKKVAEAKKQHLHETSKWEDARKAFRAEQREKNQKVDDQREAWLAGKRSAIEAYCDIVLSNSRYDECCPQEFELEYSRSNRILIVDYQLPAPEGLPSLTEVKYVISRKEFTEKHLPKTKQRKLYDSLLYQITLRTIHELFEADTVAALSAVVFNGYVTSINRGTGKETTACVLSVQANREAFLEIDLAHVDPRICFRAMKGVGSTKLHSITPVPPLQSLSRDDSRFVADQEVVDRLDEGENLAAMDWEDFEHLIREVFSKEFSGEGGEVKVTRASRDGGVDAIAFDPDPIRGGKIVIQAKRYTNVVGVSAVRDLYGTVMNEGAMKGILVTTSNYGPDAHKFASDKPLTLLDGGHLLHMLERHGHKVKIDLAEAKKLLADT